MKRITTALLTAFVLTTATLFTLPAQAQENYEVAYHSREKFKDGEIEMEYDSYDKQVKELMEQKDAKGWEDAVFEEKKAKIPKGGTLKFTISQKNEEAAKASYVKVIVRNEAGEELHKSTLGSKMPKKEGKMYVSSKWLRLEDVEMPAKFTVEAINAKTKANYEYTVEAKE